MKYFYKSMVGDMVTGLTSSPYPIRVKGLIPITEEEFNQLTPQMGTPRMENPLEELQKENKMLKAQLQAQVDRSDFIEDCIAEMATVVYGGV